MMLTIPFVIYGIFRYLYLVQVEHSGGAPEEVLFSDRPMQITLCLDGHRRAVDLLPVPQTVICLPSLLPPLEK